MDTNKIKNLLAEVKNGTKTEEDVTKEIMKDYGTAISGEQAKARQVQSDLDNANSKIKTYETEVATLKDSAKDNNDWKTKFESLDQKVKEQEAEAKAKAEDETLTNNIVSAFGDKKFTSDYVKNGLIADIKLELKKTENAGKGIKEIFESLTKDKEGIFENPNKPAGMPGMGGNSNTVDNDAEGFVSIIQENQRK